MLNKKIFKCVLVVVVAASFAVPLFSHAGCGNSEGKAWMVDAVTGKTVKKFGKGKVVQCANMHGGFTSFEIKEISFGVANCIDDCEYGFKPNVTYVRVGKKWREADDFEGNGDESCVC